MTLMKSSTKQYQIMQLKRPLESNLTNDVLLFFASSQQSPFLRKMYRLALTVLLTVFGCITTAVVSKWYQKSRLKILKCKALLF